MSASIYSYVSVIGRRKEELEPKRREGKKGGGREGGDLERARVAGTT